MDNSYKEEIEKLLKETDNIDFEIRSLNKDNRDLTAENNDKIDIWVTTLENALRGRHQLELPGRRRQYPRALTSRSSNRLPGATRSLAFCPS